MQLGTASPHPFQESWDTLDDIKLLEHLVHLIDLNHKCLVEEWRWGKVHQHQSLYYQESFVVHLLIQKYNHFEKQNRTQRRLTYS